MLRLVVVGTSLVHAGRGVVNAEVAPKRDAIISNAIDFMINDERKMGLCALPNDFCVFKSIETKRIL